MCLWEFKRASQRLLAWALWCEDISTRRGKWGLEESGLIKAGRMVKQRPWAKPGGVVHTCISSTWEVEARASGIQDQLWLYSKFDNIYTRSYLKKRKLNNKNHWARKESNSFKNRHRHQSPNRRWEEWRSPTSTTLSKASHVGWVWISQKIGNPKKLFLELLEVNGHQLLERQHPSEIFPNAVPSEAGHQAF